MLVDSGPFRAKLSDVVSVTPPHAWVDLSHYPVVILMFPASATAREVLVMTTAMRRFAADLSEPVAIVSDLSSVRSSDPEIRSVYVQFVRDMRGVAGRWVRAAAVITQSALQRTTLNIHEMLVGGTPYPVRGFATRSAAFAWLHTKLDLARNVSDAPPSV
jgi:hypothetical protein